jgi:hypothetical protein
LAIRIPASRGKAPDVVTLEEHIVPSKPPEPEKITELVWSQLEATGEIYSKPKTLTEAESQAASYTLYLLQARPDLISVVGIFIHSEKREFRLYLTDAWNVHCTQNVPFTSPLATRLLVTWIRRLYKPERSPAIKRVYTYPCKPTFTIDAGHPEAFSGCSIVGVGSGLRRPTIFTNSRVVIKSQYLKVGRRFEESKILNKIHCGGKNEFPGVVRVLPVTPTQGPATVEAGSDASASHGPTIIVAAGKGRHRGNKEIRQTLLVLKDNVPKSLMDAETPLDALIAIYDLLEGNILSSFLE